MAMSLFCKYNKAEAAISFPCKVSILAENILNMQTAHESSYLAGEKFITAYIHIHALWDVEDLFQSTLFIPYFIPVF